MNPNYHPLYRHSGKFGPHGPVLAIVASIVVGYPLGIVYAYLIKWIPFIYLNFFITIGYGFTFGLLSGMVCKACSVRNGIIALLTSFIVGLIALYFSWNGHIHSLVKDAPWLLYPGQILAAMKVLYAEGSWGIGFSSDNNVTGILLAIFWLAEAVVIVGLSAFLGHLMVAKTPYCERNRCWLDEEKKIDKLDAFIDPNQIAAIKMGDLSPLEQAKARVPSSGRFARLTIKHSGRCEEFCTLTIDNVIVTADKDGKQKETTQAIVSDLMLPKSWFDHLSRFEHLQPPTPSSV